MKPISLAVCYSLSIGGAYVQLLIIFCCAHRATLAQGLASGYSCTVVIHDKVTSANEDDVGAV